MKKILKRLSVLICGFLIIVCAISIFTSSKNTISAPTRDVELMKYDVDYQALFEEFDEAELFYNEEKQYISFSGIQTISASDLNELDLVGLTNDSGDELDVRYSFEYYEETNLFILNVKIINVDGGEILDSIPGMPFIDENGETDIAFVLEDEVVLLSEMEENSLFENCGWFSKAWKKFAPVAKVVVAVAVVVAVVVVAAPAVVAAIPTVSTVALAGGGTATVLTGGGAVAAMTAASAAASATLPTIAAVTATSLAVAAVDSGIEAEKEEKESTSSDEKESDKTWANKNTLEDHYDRHGDDFDSKDEEDYAKKTNDFYKNRDNYQTKTDSDGTVRVYDSETNTFGSYTSDGKTKTFFKPTGGQSYFDNQPGN